MTGDLQTAKSLFQDYNSARDTAAPGGETSAACQTYLSPDHTYRGMRPFYDLAGPKTRADTIWTPLKSASSMQKVVCIGVFGKVVLYPLDS